MTVRGHLDRLYEDESEWVRTATGDNECVDAEKTFTVSSYAFVHQGYIYITIRNTQTDMKSGTMMLRIPSGPRFRQPGSITERS